MLLPFSALAADYDGEKYNEYLSQYDLSFFEEKLDGDTYRYLEEIGADKFDFDSLSSMSLDDFFAVISDIISGSFSDAIKGAVSVIAYILLSSVIRGVNSENSSLMSGTYSTATALIISVLLVMQIGKTLSLCASTLGVAGSFVYAFIPVFCAIVLASGGGVTSLSSNTLLMVLAQAVSFISSNVFMPVINCFLALGICSGIRAELRLDKLIASLKSLMIWCISFISGAFVSVLSLKTAVTARADVLGIRSARFVINSVVPVIGASISEGLMSIQSYSKLIKSSVGVVGIIAVALVFLPSILRVTAWRMLLSVCQLISDVFGDNSVSLVLTSFRDTLLIANIILILSAVTTVVSIGILIAAGG
ncbi:MAG: hypothetical protein IKF64_01395 [Eubacterium sp.]|nr:hypothetical protein [Eubacterium sp.]